jgi:hypothetical protein
MNAPKKVAAIITEYRTNSHADVIVGKILEGFDQQGGPGPDLKVVSMYVDQFPEKDMSRDLAKKHGFAITRTIEEAVTLGGNTVAVEGVLSIGEHGKYPSNEKGQYLYPRRRFFEEIVKAFEKSKKVVPVFNDKHLAATWSDGKWMYDKARELFIPFMAGSSLPVAWRVPPLTLPKGCEFESVLAIGYGPTEGYGFHLLETLQCMVERRKGGETGVAAVQYLDNEHMFKTMDEGRWSKELLEAGLSYVPAKAKGDYRELCSKNKEAGVFLIDFRDGLKAAAVMLNGLAYEGHSGAFGFIARLKGQKGLAGTHFYLQNWAPFGHFGYLVKAIESMIHTGHPAYPVERTLLTTGMLDAAMTSRHEKGKRIETPYLDVKYQPLDWPFAPGPPPTKTG